MPSKAREAANGQGFHESDRAKPTTLTAWATQRAPTAAHVSAQTGKEAEAPHCANKHQARVTPPTPKQATRPNEQGRWVQIAAVRSSPNAAAHKQAAIPHKARHPKPRNTLATPRAPGSSHNGGDGRVPLPSTWIYDKAQTISGGSWILWCLCLGLPRFDDSLTSGPDTHGRRHSSILWRALHLPHSGGRTGRGRGVGGREAGRRHRQRGPTPSQLVVQQHVLPGAGSKLDDVHGAQLNVPAVRDLHQSRHPCKPRTHMSPLHADTDLSPQHTTHSTRQQQAGKAGKAARRTRSLFKKVPFVDLRSMMYGLRHKAGTKG